MRLASTSPSSSSSSLHIPQQPRLPNISQKNTRRRMSKDLSQLKSGYPLQRGSACLSCRKRKMKCDAGKPACGQCMKANRGADCDYDDGKSKSRTQILQEKIGVLENRIRELEGCPPDGKLTTATTVATGGNPQLQRMSSAPPPAAGPQGGNSHHHALYDDVMFGSNGAFDPLMPLSTAGSPSPSSSGLVWMGGGGADHFDLHIGSHPPSPKSLDWDVNPLGPLTPADLLKFSGRWWEAEEPPPRIRQLLIDIFLPHRHQCGFEIDVGRFQHSLAAGPGGPDAPHPALLNAMYALACHFSLSPALVPHEPWFIARALRAISDALETSDRLVQVLHASCLLAVLFFAKGRLLEGYYHTGAAVRLAVGLGLHQISSSEWTSPGGSPASSSEGGGGGPNSSSSAAGPSILPPPADSVERGERILAFWQVFNLDRCWSVATGMPVALWDDNHPRTRIETVWPRSLEEYSMGQASEQDYTASLLYNQMLHPPPPPPLPPFLRHESTNGLRAKASTLFERASRLSSSFGSPAQSIEQFWLDFQGVDDAITRLSASLPSALRAGSSPRQHHHQHHPSHVASNDLSSSSPSPPPPEGSTPHSSSRVDHSLFVVHVLLHAAMIQLHSPFALKDPGSQQKSTTVAMLATMMIHDLEVEDYGFLDPIMGTCWTSVAEALVRELLVRGTAAAAEGGASVEQMTALNRQLDLVVMAMNRLGATVPLAAYQASKVEESRVISY